MTNLPTLFRTRASRVFQFGLLISAGLVSLTIYGTNLPTCTKALTRNFSNLSYSDLAYFVESPSKAFSLHPLDVDSLPNDVLMRTLVGTLLRTDKSHRRIPYLADSWRNSEDFKTWSFKLKKGLTCEDKTPITAPTFVRSMNMLLKLRTRNNPAVTVFSDLKGWNEFVTGKSASIEGLSAIDESTIQFEFVHPMDSGLLAFLSIPQFGFYCSSNFDKAGEWTSQHSFVSSGAYSLTTLSKQAAKISRRSDWPLQHDGAPEEVTVRIVDKIDFTHLQSPATFAVRSNFLTSDIPKNFHVMTGATTWLRSLVVSPYTSKFFNNVENRRVFQGRLKQWMRGQELKIPLTYSTQTFYPDAPQTPAISPRNNHYVMTAPEAKVLKLIYSAPEEVVDFYLPGIQHALEGSGLKVEAIRLDRSDSNGVRRFLSNRDYDFRLIASSIGGGISNWIVDMMFCSDLGVCFPDPSGGICNLTRAQKVQPIPEPEYAKKFENLLETDASVIPLHHAGSMWIFGEAVSHEDISPVSPVPGIEQLSLK